MNGTSHLHQDRLFVLLSGPSGAGKTTIIHRLLQTTPTRFTYIRPYMTRPLRPNETDKISIDAATFAQMETDNAFLVINTHFGDIKYSTPREPISTALQQGKVPILDYQLDRVATLRRATTLDVLNIYVYPSSSEELAARLIKEKRNADERLEKGLQELQQLTTLNGHHPAIDISVINADGHLTETVQTIQHIIETIAR